MLHTDDKDALNMTSPMYNRRRFIQQATAFVGTALVVGHTTGVSAQATPITSTSITGSTSMAPFLAYTANSFYQSTTAGAPVDAARTTTFKQFMGSFPAQRGTSYPSLNGIGTNRWGTPFAIGTSTDPVWKLTGAVPAEVGILKTQGFHAPLSFASFLTGTSDSPFCVIDRASGYTVFGGKAKANVSNRTISVTSAGITYHSSNGLTRRNPRSDDNRNFTSRGRISDSMVIRRDLVDHGIANHTGLGHVLHLFMVETKSSDGFCHPMVQCESGQNGWGAEGQRIAVRPDVDLSARGFSPFGLVIARTLQTHGCYLGDNAGSGASLKVEQASATHNPWAGLSVTQDALKPLTWGDFIVLPKGWQ